MWNDVLLQEPFCGGGMWWWYVVVVVECGGRGGLKMRVKGNIRRRRRSENEGQG